jgi:curved DNA-binding protein CbpA
VASESAHSARLAALAALGLGPEAKAADIVSAYRRLARRSHPDMASGGSVSEHDFAAISEAYHLLTRGFQRPFLSTRIPDDPDQTDATGSHLTEPAEPEEPARDDSPQWRYPSEAETSGQPIIVAGPVIVRPLPPESR